MRSIRIVMAMATSLMVSACGGTAHRAEHPVTGERASAAFRAEHAALLTRIDETEASAIALSSTPEAELGERVHGIVAFFKHELLPHAQAEETVLYAVADRLVPTDPPRRWTDSLRYEHTVIGAAIDEMFAFMQSGDHSPEGIARFQAKALMTLGLVRGHFGAEENVVLEALDHRMTPDEFRRDIIEPTVAYVEAHGGAGAHHH